MDATNTVAHELEGYGVRTFLVKSGHHLRRTAQEQFHVLALKPSIIQDAIEGGEGHAHTYA